MFIRSIKDSKEIIAGDATKLWEICNPLKDKSLVLHYSLAYAEVLPRQDTLPHSLKSAEVYYILAGRGKMYIDDESSAVSKNDVIYIPPNALQHILNTGEEALCFLCIVEPAWKPEDEVVN